ncbi:hypothetical protein BDZ97DRAFT_1917311 [Flammula alnicola]|nr:hypothetical protein BDZ97DRAFT_1917311 [Flammula alnicola]
MPSFFQRLKTPLSRRSTTNPREPYTSQSTPTKIEPPAPAPNERSKYESQVYKIWHTAKSSLSWGKSRSTPPASISLNDQTYPYQQSPRNPSSLSLSTGSIPHKQKDPDDNEGMNSGEREQFLSPTTQHRKSKLQSNWKGSRKSGKTAVSVAKYGLQTLKESADAFPPLKSVVSGLSFLLSTYEQWVSNKEDLQRLLRRVELLQKMFEQDEDLYGNQDSGEKERRSELTRRLQDIAQCLDEIQREHSLQSFAEAGKEAKIISGFVADIRDAILDYEVSLQMFMHKQVNGQIALDEMRDLQTLLRARNASHLSEHHKYCLKGTRVEVLRVIEDWADDLEALRVYWLNGHAGSGKSTIAQSFSRRIDLRVIFPTLSFQLACQFPAFRAHVVQTLRVRPDICSESLTNQLVELIIEPLESTNLSTLIVIDALDECKDDMPASAILSLLARYISRIPNVKWFITGRPEAPIRSGFRLASLQPLTQIFILHDVERSAVEHDIELYARIRLSEYVKDRSNLEITLPWPSDEDIQILVNKSFGLFIFIVTAVTFVTSPGHMPDKQLSLITQAPDINIHEGRSGLDVLYTTIIEIGYGLVNGEPDYFSDLRSVWGSIVTAFNPLSRNGLSTLLAKSPAEISTSLRLQHSVLRVPSSSSEPVRIYHKSFPDYLTDLLRCMDKRFFIDAKHHHTQMALRCLRLMASDLKKNICHLPPFSMNKIMPLSSRRQKIGEGLEYACRFWAQHLTEASSLPSVEEKNIILAFLRGFFSETRMQFFWLEVLSLVEDLHISAYSLNRIKIWILKCAANEHDLLNDISSSEKFILQFFDCVKESALHLYQSAIPQIPLESHMRNQSLGLSTDITVRQGLNTDFKANTRSIVTKLKAVTSLRFCSDGSKIGATGEGGVQIFDFTTGECLATMPTPSNCISVEFSQDDSLLLTTYLDNVIRLWDVQTGGLIRNYVGHQARIHDISFAARGSLFASVDEDGHIFLWNVKDGNSDHSFSTSSSSTRIFCKWLSGTALITHSSPSGGTYIHDIMRGGSSLVRAPQRDGVSILTTTRYGLQIVERERNRFRMVSLDGAGMPKLVKETVELSFPPQHTTQRVQNSALHLMTMSLDERHLVLLRSDKGSQSLCLYRSVQTSNLPRSSAWQASSSIYHSSSITSSIFSPDGSYIAFGSADGMINLRTIETDYHRFPSSTAITSVCVSQDGQLFAYATKAGQIEVYSSPENWLTAQISSDSMSIWRGAVIENMAFNPENDFLAIHYKNIINDKGIQRVSLGLVFWNFNSNHLEGESTMVIPTGAISPKCILQGETSLLLRILYTNHSIRFQIWARTSFKLQCEWDSPVRYSLPILKWPLSINVNGTKQLQILIQYEDQTAAYRQAWTITFNDKKNTFILASSHPEHGALQSPSHRVFGDNWILNEKGQRIFWVPYDIALPDEDWQERACWMGRTLILGGREGRLMVIDFSDKAAQPVKY